MNRGDPDESYPYPTEGVLYSAPPWEADYVGVSAYQATVGGYGDEGGDDDDDDDDDDGGGGASLMDIDEPNRGQDEQDGGVKLAAGTSPGVATFGVKLEFLLVQCPRVRMDDGENLTTKDPHPNDPRWISSMMAEWEIEEMESQRDSDLLEDAEEINGTYCDYNEDCEQRRARYSRTKLTRVLRDSGLVAIKWPNQDIYENEEDLATVPINDFSESEDSDDEREENYTNKSRLNEFQSVYTRDPSMTGNQNYEAALAAWEASYVQYHQDNGLKLYRTREVDIKKLIITRCTVNQWPELTNMRLEHLRSVLDERLRKKRIEAKQQREDQRNGQADPLHVPVPGLKPQYRAWTTTVDYSVDGNGMTKRRYKNTESAAPFDEYFWFGAEVVSPVLPMGDERSRQAVRTACGAIRDALRCHKPMEVSTGLHIHMGHTHGWTLYQAKRFATLWFLAEKTILHLHRADRDRDAKLTVECYQWCAKIRGGSVLWRALYSPDEDQRTKYADAVQKHRPARKLEYETQMKANLPGDGLEWQEEEFLRHVWQYDSITVLHQGLGENYYCRTGIKWRIRGRESSLDGETELDRQPGTIEARIMHGTLDAYHINNWVTVLERIVHVVRDYQDKAFQDFLGEFIVDRTIGRLLELLGVSDEIKQYWLDPKRRDGQNQYWQYPDRDVVDWKEPFMVPGHKATHGSYWD
ncbi:hypothetical protein F5Y08DRAFT_327932 [Xylaria arbuscula]|nr:hypothetical protein F5Y08DRAFT_327932 [Xylaria arbuscula]